MMSATWDALKPRPLNVFWTAAMPALALLWPASMDRTMADTAGPMLAERWDFRSSMAAVMPPGPRMSLASWNWLMPMVFSSVIAFGTGAAIRRMARSEERRVGKEC